MLKRFIERPVLSTVISIILLLLGVLALYTLPITLFPDIAPPSVVVTANYPGANAEVVARSVAVPLEEAINGVENMTYMTSNSSNDGSMTLTVYFKQGTNPDIASVNVQNRVAKATSQIPQEVIQAGISTQKQQNSIIMFIAVYSKDSSAYDETFLQNYIKINLIPKLQRIPGVGDAQAFGTKDYSMRIWLKPDRLMAYNLSPIEVTDAIRDQSLEAAPGRLGQSSNEVFEYVLKYKGKLNKNEDYENIIVKSNSDGSAVRLKDVARVEFGSYTYSSNGTLNGYPTSGVAVFQVAGSNANDILTEAQKLVKKFTADLPKGLGTSIMYNSKEFLDASIDQVLRTLVEAFILVFIVVFLFLQDFRSTLIPAIAVPVAIVGTFFFMQLFGFTINLLTLFALVLAIGIVVDDAIVVVEAVHAKLESTGLEPKEATVRSMSEISGAIISITLVMAAVFIPVGFMQGPAGVFYRQFAFTLATAILISAVNALTLSPALCALFLRGGHRERKRHRGPVLYRLQYRLPDDDAALPAKPSVPLPSPLDTDRRAGRAGGYLLPHDGADAQRVYSDGGSGFPVVCRPDAAGKLAGADAQGHAGDRQHHQGGPDHGQTLQYRRAELHLKCQCVALWRRLRPDEAGRPAGSGQGYQRDHRIDDDEGGQWREGCPCLLFHLPDDTGLWECGGIRVHAAGPGERIAG